MFSLEPQVLEILESCLGSYILSLGTPGFWDPRGITLGIFVNSPTSKSWDPEAVALGSIDRFTSRSEDPKVPTLSKPLGPQNLGILGCVPNEFCLLSTLEPRNPKILE